MERMESRYTFYIIGSGRRSFRQLVFSGRQDVMCVALFVALAVILSILLSAGWVAVRHRGTAAALMQELARQKAEIDAKESQLLAMAQEINGLKENLLDLHDFEQKIRVIASLGPTSGGDSLLMKSVAPWGSC